MNYIHVANILSASRQITNMLCIAPRFLHSQAAFSGLLSPNWLGSSTSLVIWFPAAGYHVWVVGVFKESHNGEWYWGVVEEWSVGLHGSATSDSKRCCWITKQLKLLTWNSLSVQFVINSGVNIPCWPGTKNITKTRRSTADGWKHWGSICRNGAAWRRIGPTVRSAVWGWTSTSAQILSWSYRTFKEDNCISSLKLHTCKAKSLLNIYIIIMCICKMAMFWMFVCVPSIFLKTMFYPLIKSASYHRN